MGRSHYIQQIFSGNNSKRLAVQFSDARKVFKNIADRHAEAKIVSINIDSVVIVENVL